MSNEKEINEGVTTFLQTNAKKVLLLVASDELVVINATKHLLNNQNSFLVYYCSLAEWPALAASFEKAPPIQPLLFVFYDLEKVKRWENFYTRCQLNRWSAKIIFICPKFLLHTPSDPSIYFAPINGRRLQRNQLTTIILTPSIVPISRIISSIPTLVGTVPLPEEQLKHHNDWRSHFLNQKIMTNDLQMMRKLADRVLVSDEFKQQLFKFIYASRGDEQLQVAAANAITALCLAEVSFSGLDFSYIRISRSNLQFGIFYKTNLSYADLSFAYLRCACLKEAILDGCNFNGADFDELPLLLPDVQLSRIDSDHLSNVVIALAAKAHVLDATTFKLKFELIIKESNHFCCAFHPTLPLIITVDGLGGIFCWSTTDGRLLAEKHLDSCYGYVNSVAFSQNGTYLAWGSYLRKTLIEIWDIQKNKLYQILMGNNRISLLRFIQDKYLIFLSNGKLQEIDLTTLSLNNSFYRTLRNGITCFQFDMTGHLLVVGYNDNNLFLYDRVTGKQLFVLKGHLASIYSVDWSPNNKKIVSGSDDTSIRIWDASTGICERILSGHKGRTSVRWSPQNNIIFSCSDNSGHGIKVWDISQSPHFWQNNRFHAEVSCLAFSKRGGLIATGGKDGYVRILSSRNGMCLYTSTIMLSQQVNKEKQIESVCFEPCSLPNRLTLAAASGKEIFIWAIGEISSSENSLVGHTQIINDISYSNNGRFLASGSDDKTVRIWDIKSLTTRRVLLGHQEAVHCVRFSPNDTYVASSGGNIAMPQKHGNDIHLWEIETGSCLKVLRGHQNPVWLVAFSPDQRVLASLSSDHTLRLWDISTNQCTVLVEERELPAVSPHVRHVHVAQMNGKQPTIKRKEMGLVLTFNKEGTMLISGGGSTKLRLRHIHNLSLPYEIFVGKMAYTIFHFVDGNSNFHLAVIDNQNYSIKLWNIWWRQFNILQIDLLWLTKPLLDCRDCSTQHVKNMSEKNHEIFKQNNRRVIPDKTVMQSKTDNIISNEPTILSEEQQLRFTTFINSNLLFFLRARPETIEHSLLEREEMDLLKATELSLQP